MTIEEQLTILSENREKLGGIEFPWELYQSCVILIKNGLAYISEINDEGNPILMATELGRAQSEAWEQEALQ
jgi:hypothetical protein